MSRVSVSYSIIILRIYTQNNCQSARYYSSVFLMGDCTKHLIAESACGRVEVIVLIEISQIGDVEIGEEEPVCFVAGCVTVNKVTRQFHGFQETRDIH